MEGDGDYKPESEGSPSEGESEGEESKQSEPVDVADAEEKDIKKQAKKARKRKAKEPEEDIFEAPNPYFYPRYTQKRKDEFKEKFLEVISGVEGTELDDDTKDKLKDVVYEYEMHKRPQAIDEIFEIVREHFTSGDEMTIERATLMSSVYETLMQRIMQPRPLIEETMFFPSKESEKRLALILAKAKKTLEICVFAFTNNVLAKALLNRHREGVKIRIITDDECSKFFGADIWSLVLEGVECTMDNHKRYHMHNKFVIIDDLVLVTGSFNWTSQAVTGNQENLCVIDNENFIKDYKQEFERLWDEFAPNRITEDMAKQTLEEQEVEKQRRIEKGKETRKRNKEAKMKAKAEAEGDE